MTYEENAFAEFMAKLEQKMKDVNDDFNKLSPRNKEKVAFAIKLKFGIDITAFFFQK